jgi:hypothetical protein
LGYNSEGAIEDQTDQDRLTVPESIIAKSINRLTTQNIALLNDRKSFIDNFSPSSLIPNLHWDSVVGEDQPTKEIVVPLGGYGNLIIRSNKSSSLQLNAGCLELLGRDEANFPDASTFYLLPQIALRGSATGPITGAVFSSAAHFPQLLTSFNLLEWRMIALGDMLSQSSCSVVLELVIYNQRFAYIFTVNRTSDGNYRSNDMMPTTDVFFNDINSFKTFVQTYHLVDMTSVQTYGLYYDTSLHFVTWANMSADMQNTVVKYFTMAFQGYNDNVAVTNDKAAVSRIIFDAIMSLTPEDITAAITALTSQ